MTYKLNNVFGGTLSLTQSINQPSKERLRLRAKTWTAGDSDSDSTPLVCCYADFTISSLTGTEMVCCSAANGKHTSAVWQLRWIEKESGTVDEHEVLISTSTDGRVTQWAIRKDFECTGNTSHIHTHTHTHTRGGHRLPTSTCSCLAALKFSLRLVSR